MVCRVDESWRKCRIQIAVAPDDGVVDVGLAGAVVYLLDARAGVARHGRVDDCGCGGYGYTAVLVVEDFAVYHIGSACNIQSAAAVIGRAALACGVVEYCVIGYCRSRRPHHHRPVHIDGSAAACIVIDQEASSDGECSSTRVVTGHEDSSAPSRCICGIAVSMSLGYAEAVDDRGQRIVVA